MQSLEVDVNGQRKLLSIDPNCAVVLAMGAIKSTRRALWINLSPFESDEFGVARAWMQLVATDADNAVWDTMDQAALALVQQVAGSAANIEYFTIAAGRARRPPWKPFGVRCATVWERRITNPGHCG